MSGDKDEVLRLLDQGADIDTANVDGLTALHQVSDNVTSINNLNLTHRFRTPIMKNIVYYRQTHGVSDYLVIYNKYKSLLK